MRKARAIALKRKTPLMQALDSAYNFSMFLGDMMYGTPERTRITTRVAFAVLVLGCVLIASEAGASVCLNA